ncbi:MAG: hypothetical protein JXO22_06255, partial [Phycisphaerae bacterium]|nr:hypothetical protein [Phycisphaerae bacterium]
LLDYSAAVSGSLGGSASGSIAALTAPATHALPVNTSTAGNKSGGVLLTSTSEAVANSPLALSCNGTVIRAANASFESADDVQSYTVTASAEPDSGLLPLSVPVYNRGYDSAQALLDIDNVTTPDAPFVLEGGLTTGIGAQPATLDFSFDTAGMSSGSFSTLVGITVSDEDIPGESNTLLTLTLTVNIGGSVVGDMNCDGATDVFDIDAFVLALTDQVGYEMAYPECARDRADVNTDGLVDVFDIDAFVDLISGH